MQPADSIEIRKALMGMGGWGLLLVGLLLGGCGAADDATAPGDAAALLGATRASRCADADPSRRAYFGDLHVHTTISSDAWQFDVRTTPDEAYRYAFGGAVMLPPLDEAGRPTRRHVNPRPLDFMAVTDHAEFLGEQKICTTPGMEGHDSAFCVQLRESEGRPPMLLKQIFSPFPARDEAVCGEGGERCAQVTRSLWQETRAAAARWNRPCEQTTFVAYEYSSFRMGSNLHRNVIFRDDRVPDAPISFVEAVRDYELWEGLARECLDAGFGCDVLAIPHNMNISNGRMFSINYPGAWTRSAKADLARLRMRVEPIVEMMQHKGDSECRNGLPGVQGGVDELCDFEKFENGAFGNTGKVLGEAEASEEAAEAPEVEDCYEGPGADWWPHLGPDCLSRQSYVRYALIEGLRQADEIGVNPFKFGLSASTDTHNGIGGGTEEAIYPGHLGIGDDTIAKRTSADRDVAGNTNNNPGGLIGVWAEENSRDAIFDAMRRREVFGTSGPRMQVRFYGGWGLDPGLCTAPDRLLQADRQAVPMGSDLPPAGDADAGPGFLVMAMADPGTPDAPGTPLQKVQVVKGWIGEDGDHHQRLYDVVGSPDNGARVDLATCRPVGSGHRDLCTVWRDPDFDPEERAVYYLRAVENPTCRYSWAQCLEVAPEARSDGCEDPRFPRTLQERAWSSPIWYTPDA